MMWTKNIVPFQRKRKEIYKVFGRVSEDLQT